MVTRGHPCVLLDKTRAIEHLTCFWSMGVKPTETRDRGLTKFIFQLCYLLIRKRFPFLIPCLKLVVLTFLTSDCMSIPWFAEEVGQPIRRTSRPIRLRHFPHARTGLVSGLINIDFLSYCYAIFFRNFRRYYFYNSQSTHWNLER